MAIRPICKMGDEVLRVQTEPVSEFDEALHELIEDMVATMYDAPGVGLAANQIGIAKDLMIIDVTSGEEPDALVVCANARITKIEGEQTGDEGCLSVPGFYEIVTRPERVWFKFQDRHGKWQEMETSGLMARAVCHETDHLRGLLYVDLLRGLKKERILRKVRKLARAGDW